MLPEGALAGLLGEFKTRGFRVRCGVLAHRFPAFARTSDVGEGGPTDKFRENCVSPGVGASRSCRSRDASIACRWTRDQIPRGQILTSARQFPRPSRVPSAAAACATGLKRGSRRRRKRSGKMGCAKQSERIGGERGAGEVLEAERRAVSPGAQLLTYRNLDAMRPLPWPFGRRARPRHRVVQAPAAVAGRETPMLRDTSSGVSRARRSSGWPRGASSSAMRAAGSISAARQKTC